MPKRAVLDTSVVIPALLFRGSLARQVLQECIRRGWTIVLWRGLYDECRKAQNDLGSRGRTLMRRFLDFASTYHAIEWLPEPDLSGRTYPSSTGDWHVFAASEDAQADYLIHKNAKDFERPELKASLALSGVVVLETPSAAKELAKTKPTSPPPDSLNWLF